MESEKIDKKFKITDENVSTDIIDKAFNCIYGMSFPDTPKVRIMIKVKVDSILNSLQADRLGISVEEYLSNKEYYIKILCLGLTKIEFESLNQ